MLLRQMSEKNQSRKKFEFLVIDSGLTDGGRGANRPS